MDRYERVERVDYKSARDVVTEVDHLSEELIIEAIRAPPDDGILAEESGDNVAVAGESAHVGPGPVMDVDRSTGPINYANGIPYFCVSIGSPSTAARGRGHPRSVAGRDLRGDSRRSWVDGRGPRDIRIRARTS